MPFVESSLGKESNRGKILVLDFSLLEKYGEDAVSVRQAHKILLLEKEEENTDKLYFCFLLFSVLITAFHLEYH